MNKTIFKSIFLFLICTNIYSNSYPISPRPLRKLVMESDAIIVGDVIKVYKNEPKIESKKRRKKSNYSSSYSIARIVIRETLQGQVNNDTIEITFEPNMICPAPPMYFENSKVLVFLDNKNGKYDTHALSYGSKTLDTIGIKVYKDRIQEIQSIIKIEDSAVKQNHTIEWLVKCAENPITRWEGVFELSPESNFMSMYSQEPNQVLKDHLNADQKARLKKALELSYETSYYDFGLSDLIYLDNQEEINSILLEKLKKLDSKSYWFASDFMVRLKHLKDNAEMESLLKKQSEIEYSYNNESERKKIIDEFVALIEK